MNTIAQRVAAGVAYLDKEAGGPGWASHIDLDRLDLQDAYDCVLGQLYGDFDLMPFHWAASSAEDGFRFAVEKGFHIACTCCYGGDDVTAQDKDWDALTAQWRQVIIERQLIAADAFMACLRAAPELVVAA
jgi:hypothetical protein